MPDTSVIRSFYVPNKLASEIARLSKKYQFDFDDCVNNALTLLQWAYQQRASGRILAAIYEDKNSYRELKLESLALSKNLHFFNAVKQPFAVEKNQIILLDNLRVLCGAKDDSDLMHRALSLLLWAVEETEKGALIGSVDEANKIWQDVRTPLLASVRAQAFPNAASA